MNEIQVAQMEAFIERNGYKRMGFEDYRGQRIYVAERRVGQYWDVTWHSMGVRGYIQCKWGSTRAVRQAVALLDAKGFVDNLTDAMARRH